MTVVMQVRKEGVNRLWAILIFMEIAKILRLAYLLAEIRKSCLRNKSHIKLYGTEWKVGHFISCLCFLSGPLVFQLLNSK